LCSVIKVTTNCFLHSLCSPHFVARRGRSLLLLVVYMINNGSHSGCQFCAIFVEKCVFLYYPCSAYLKMKIPLTMKYKIISFWRLRIFIYFKIQ
jgi:hypothetical protein